MAVIVGSARSNEKGTVTGGVAGDQTGKEVSTQAWYLHSKGWVVLRANDPDVREMIARDMEFACANDHIGYCQTHRTTATNLAKKYGYDFSKVKEDCESDCSDLVRGCCLYAGISVGTFNTATERSALEATGKFTTLLSSKYCNSSQYLMRGDILVTKTKGHTVVVLSNGSQVATSSLGISVNMPQIKKGSKGMAVKVWQAMVGANPDGDFGSDTETKTKSFQSSHGLSADGIVGKNSWAKGIDIVCVTIAKGSRGTSVTTWQVIIGVTADSIFGTDSYNKTRTFQSEHGLTADGVVGKNSWTAGLESCATTGSTSTPVTESPSTSDAYPTLKVGSKGTAVKVWQAIVGANPDGDFGSDTAAKTKTFQTNHGLSVDGIVGKNSWAKGIDTVTTTIRKGSKGTAVKVWQVIVGSNPDGDFGSDTETKTKTFQSNHGLAVDGIVGTKSWGAGFDSLK